MKLSTIKNHFNLHPEMRTVKDAAAESISNAADAVRRAAPAAASGWWTVAQWVAMFAGVASRMWLDGDMIGPTKIAVAAITATVVFPTAYRRTMAGSESHFLKLCVTFAAGHGYQSLMDAA